MAQRFIEPIARIFTNAGAVGVGYKYFFYQTGTTTPVTTYQNAGLTVANTNPVISDANGRFPEIWYSDLSQLKLVVKDSLNNTLETVDPVGATASAVSLNDFDVRPTSYWGLTAGTSTAFTLVANPTISAYANTQTFVVQPHLDCGDNPTLAIDGLSALNWKKYTQQGTKVAMKANDLRASQRYFNINDGVDIVCLNPSSLPILSGSKTALTIATGAVTLTNNSSSYVLDTEGAAATDDLDTINGAQDGQIIYLNTANNSRDVTLRSGVGNIVNSTGLNITLGNTNDLVCLRYNGTNWIVEYFNYSDAEPIKLISTSTASNSATIDFINLTSSYTRYVVQITDLKAATDGVNLYARMSSDNGATFDSAAANYNFNFMNPNNSGGGSATQIQILDVSTSSRALGNAAGEFLNADIKIFNPSNANHFCTIGFVTHHQNQDGAVTINHGSGQRSTAKAINGIRLFLSVGNITSGIFKLYGIR